MADKLNNGQQVQSTEGHESEAINVAGLKAALQKFKTDKVDPLQWPMVAVPVLPEASASTMHKIYLVPSTNPKQKNAKDEFITIATTETVEEQEVTTYFWEQIGSTTANLSGYVTQVNVGETSYSPSSGVVSLPAYPTALPANGGNAATVDNHTVGTDVPANAVFTDHTYSVMGASGQTHASGLVPDTPTTAGTTKYLCEDGTWKELSVISTVALTADVSSTCSITGSGNANKTEVIVYTNSSGSDKVVTVPTTYATPDGAAIEITVPNGGYCEVNYLNVGGTIYARGL